jgi:hypothetical protein
MWFDLLIEARLRSPQAYAPYHHQWDLESLLVLGARIVYRKVPDSQSPAKPVKHIIPPLSPEL